MDLAITIGQGLGFGVACGLSTIALLVPLFWPGIDALALGALGAPGLAVAAIDAWLPQIARSLLRVAAGAAAGEFWLHDDLAWAGLAIGGAAAGAMALSAVPLAESAARAGSRPATALIAAVAALIVAAAALVPFVGYPLALVAIFLALRTRRRGDQRYQGLRILR
jgi:hypothetical protein